MKRVATALGCTEGQAYTATLGVLLAVVLSVTGLPSAFRDLPAAPAAAVAAGATSATVAAPGVTVARPAPAGTGARTPSSPVTSPAAPIAAGPAGRPVDDSPPAPEPPTAPPCAQAGMNDGAAGVLGQLEVLSGGAAPTQSTTTVLAILTGCSTSDPALVVVGTLIELGDTLPDPGLDGLLPATPALDVPAPVAALAPSLQPILGPVCDAGSTAALLIFIFASHYPAPFDEGFLRTSNGLLALCAQLRPLPAPD